jgi:hypothetical protein
MHPLHDLRTPHWQQHHHPRYRPAILGMGVQMESVRRVCRQREEARSSGGGMDAGIERGCAGLLGMLRSRRRVVCMFFAGWTFWEVLVQAVREFQTSQLRSEICDWDD